MAILKLLRPSQWLKNILIFVPLFFAKELFFWPKAEAAFLAFIIFSLVASAVYIINDLIDLNADRLHPQKKFRPVAAGKVSPLAAKFVSGCLILFSTFLIFKFLPQIALVMLVYFILNLAYSFYFKNLPLFDILFIAGFYLLRVEAGGLATNIFLSKWLMLCLIFISLLVVIGKRIAESVRAVHRLVLDYYDSALLNNLLLLSAGLAVSAYGIYSVLGVASPYAVYSIFFVLLGVFRYLYLIRVSVLVERPESILFRDKVLLLSIIGWLFYIGIIFYFV